MNRSLVPLLALLLATPLSAAEIPVRPGDEGVNLRVTLAIAHADAAGGLERTVDALMLEDQRTRLVSGWRMPTLTERDGESAASVRYQDIGLGVTLHGRRLAGERIRVAGDVDLSSTEPGENEPISTSGAPVVTNFSHRFDVVVAPGVPTALARVPRLDGGSMTLTITAAIAD